MAQMSKSKSRVSKKRQSQATSRLSLETPFPSVSSRNTATQGRSTPAQIISRTRSRSNRQHEIPSQSRSRFAQSRSPSVSHRASAQTQERITTVLAHRTRSNQRLATLSRNSSRSTQSPPETQGALNSESRRPARSTNVPRRFM